MNSIYVCGTVRDAGKRLVRNIQKLYLQLAGYRTHWYFYENDSTDNTRGILVKASGQIPDFHFLSEDLNQPRMRGADSKRAQMMCRCRNKYLKELKRLDYDFDYTLVVDMDLAFIDASLMPVLMSHGADMLGANGRCQGIYYDTWALEGMSSSNANALTAQSDMIKVLSCFGGMGLYKTSSLVDCWYNPLVSHARYADHGTLHEAMRAKGRDEIYICPQWILRWI